MDDEYERRIKALGHLYLTAPGPIPSGPSEETLLYRENESLRALVKELVECLDDELVCTRAHHWMDDEHVPKRDKLIARARKAVEL